MTFDVLGELNWLAVLVAAVLYFGLGALWYNPIMFGDQWTRAIGWDPSGEVQMRPIDYVVPFFAYLVAVIALGMLTGATGTDSVTEGLVLGVVVGVGFAVTIVFVTAVFEPLKPQPMVWFAINGAYHLLGILISAVILAIW